MPKKAAPSMRIQIGPVEARNSVFLAPMSGSSGAPAGGHDEGCCGHGIPFPWQPPLGKRLGGADL